MVVGLELVVAVLVERKCRQEETRRWLFSSAAYTAFDTFPLVEQVFDEKGAFVDR